MKEFSNFFICNQSSIETRFCYKDCKCNLTEWSEWTPCSSICGIGYSNRSRTFSNSGTNCQENLLETKFCGTECCSINGKWSSWSSWSQCSVSCNSGLKKRTRDCKSPEPSCGGNYCEGKGIDFQECNSQPCGNIFF